MPIRVQCSCGQAFAAPDKYAGKTVKCPKCGSPLAIPAAAAAPSPAPAKPAAKPQAAKPQPAAANPFAQAPGRDLFSEAGIQAMPSDTSFCPGCGKPMANSAILCIQCGYHREKGQKLSTTATGGGAPAAGGGHGGGHGGDSVEVTLARAARFLDESKAEEAKTRSQGMPAWAYGGMLIGLLLLTYYMSTVGVGGSLVTLGWLIIIGCSLTQFYYNILILVAASKEGMIQVLLLFVPLYIFYYVATRWETVGNFFLMSLYASFAAGFGYFFVIIGAMIGAPKPPGADDTGELLRQLTVLIG